MTMRRIKYRSQKCEISFRKQSYKSRYIKKNSYHVRDPNPNQANLRRSLYGHSRKIKI